ncbi:MAG TPA: hypothetical protein VK826_17820, partial [Bacteroidia bacterium]|nr:hypothetical protein [Bacteroidia bacterium]
MKHIYTFVLILITGLHAAGNAFDSIRQVKVDELNRIAEFWKTQPTTHDTVFCAGFCGVAVIRPVYLHDGNFPSGSEFDFMNAKTGDVLGP